jgi:ABC-type amino acid transport substrate-binding protein
VAVGSAGLLLTAGCTVPRDSAETLERVRHGGELRVGVADHPPWVRINDDGVGGIEPGLIEAWAAQLGGRVVWHPGPEAQLVEALDHREIDVIAAGFDSSTPHKARLALTSPYLEVEDRFGSRRSHVIAVMPGESALLLSLDRFLASQDRAALRRAASQPAGEATGQ